MIKSGYSKIQPRGFCSNASSHFMTFEVQLELICLVLLWELCCLCILGKVTDLFSLRVDILPDSCLVPAFLQHDVYII